jgi:hypothetical protein
LLLASLSRLCFVVLVFFLNKNIVYMLSVLLISACSIFAQL